MKRKILNIIIIMTTSSSLMAQNGKATTVRKTFSRTTSVAINIKADSSIIWNLLTNASDYSRWNSTIISIKGEIKLNEKIALKSTLDSNRTFKLKIKQLENNKLLVWGDAMGNRVYTLTPKADGTVDFTMTEKIGGPMFPIFAKMIPSFDESFEKFALDLKTEAERINNLN